VRSEHPSGEGGSVGGADVYVERAAYVHQACDEVGDVRELKVSAGEKLWWLVFTGRGAFVRVSTAVEQCPSHPHICHAAKLEQNQTVSGRVIAI